MLIDRGRSVYSSEDEHEIARLKKLLRGLTERERMLLHTLLEEGRVEERTCQPPPQILEISNLSPRERQVMHGMLAFKSTKQIARDLALSPKTVEVYRGRVLSKLGVASTLHLVSAYAASVH